MNLRGRIHEIIFEADTKSGKVFDIALLIAILASIVLVMLQSVGYIQAKYTTLFFILDWILTILFTAEYILRVYAVKRPLRYIFSFYGIVDLLAILPSYLALFFAASKVLVTIRALRLLRVFRVLKMGPFLSESAGMINALRASRAKITVFMGAILVIVVIVGSVMYAVEGQVNEQFTSIPKSMYWAIVTMTTVGYGDLVPRTAVGQFLSSALMILGYAIIAVPTGIVSVEMSKTKQAEFNTQSCQNCGREGHDSNARHCKFCGDKLR